MINITCSKCGRKLELTDCLCDCCKKDSRMALDIKCNHCGNELACSYYLDGTEYKTTISRCPCQGLVGANKTITISEADFDKAWDKISRYTDCGSDEYWYPIEARNKLKKELGFK